MWQHRGPGVAPRVLASRSGVSVITLFGRSKLEVFTFSPKSNILRYDLNPIYYRLGMVCLNQVNISLLVTKTESPAAIEALLHSGMLLPHLH